MFPLHIAATDMAPWFWLLIVITTMIAQIVKALRGRLPASTPQQEREDSSAPFGEPEDIRDFMDRLSREQQKPRPPEPPKKSPKTSVSPLIPRQDLRPTAEEKAIRPPTIKRRRSGRPAIIPTAAQFAGPALPMTGMPSVRPSAIRSSLRESSSLRKAIVLREILGPPKALNNAG